MSAQDLFDYCTLDMSDKFIFQFVSKAEVQDQRKSYKAMMLNLEAVPGTRTFHFIKPSSGNVVACWKVSNDQHDPPSLIHALQKNSRLAEQSETPTYSNGMYVVVRLAKNRYIGMVNDIYNDQSELDVAVLMQRLPTSILNWPKEQKTATVPFPHVVCTIELEEKQEKLQFTRLDIVVFLEDFETKVKVWCWYFYIEMYK